MKRRFTILTAAFALLAILAIPMGIMGQTTSTYTFTSKSWTATLNGSAANWTSGKDGAGFSNNGIQVTTSATGANGTSPVSYTDVTKIVCTYNTNKSKGAGSIVAKIGDNTETSNSVAYSGSADGTSANFTTEFNYATPQSGNVTLTVNCTTNSIYLVSVAITTAGGTQPTTYTVTYDANGGAGTMTDSNSPYTSGATVTVLANTFTRDNYTFSKWNTAADGSGTDYVAGNTFIINANTTLYAQWTENGGGTGGDGTLTFDFEDDGAHRASGSNSYGNNSYEENGVDIDMTYFDAIQNGAIGGSYLARGRVAKNTTNSPVMIIGPIDITNKTITGVSFKTEGPNTITEAFATSTDGTNYTDHLTFTLTSTSTVEQKTVSNLEITGLELYLKWTGSVSSSTGSNRDFDVDDIVVTYTDASNPAVATTTTISVPSDFNNDLHNGTNAGTLSATVTAEGTAISGTSVTWSSSDTGVATVDANGAVTLVAVGTTTITASYAGVTDQYRPSSATYSLEVTDSTPVLEATFIFNTDEGLADLNITKPNAGDGTDLEANHDYVIGIVTMNVTHASTPTRIWGLSGGATELRAYSGSSLTFSVPSGYAVTKVTFTGSALPYSELTSGTWTSTGEAVSTITFNCTNTAKVSTITVEYEENASVVAAPTLPASTNFYPEMTVEITNNTSGATVYYTTDGSDPKTSNTRIEYTQSFTLNATTTVKAVALKDSNYSQVVEATYTLVDVLETMQAVFNAAGNETTNVFINFNNYVVSGVSTNGKNVFVTDNNGNGFVIFNNNGGLNQTYSVGSILSGTAVPCNLVKYNGFAELLNVDASNLTITAGGTVSTSNIAMANLAGVNTGALVSYENLTCSVDDSGNTPKYYLTDGTTTLQVYNALYAFDALEDGETYNITGIYQQYNNNNNNNKEILPRSAADIERVYTLTINGYQSDENEGGYYLIASPVTVDLTDHDHEMITGDFDLYYFDQAKADEWRNYKQVAFSLEPGKGYLYAHKVGGEFTLTGTAYTGNGTIELTYDDNAIDFKGWNLVGNPWGVKAYPNHAFYTMAEGGAGIDVTVNEAGTEVAPMTGIFVVAEGADETVTFSKTATGKSANLALNITNSSKLVDRAIVRFGEGRQLPKFQLRDNSTKIYFEQSNKDYAIVNAEEIGEMPVSFKAENNGTYTFSVNTENVEMEYLHLIDNMTGADIDLIANPSYSFEAKVTDYASRFRLVFSANSSVNEQNANNFAFFNGNDWTINNEGEATLQVVDMTGRVLSTETVNGNATTKVNAATGVYMLRLINGNNIKTQKVVVK